MTRCVAPIPNFEESRTRTLRAEDSIIARLTSTFSSSGWYSWPPRREVVDMKHVVACRDRMVASVVAP